MIEAVLAASIMLAAVTGCSDREAISYNNDPGEDYSTDNSVISDDTESSESSSDETSEPPEEEYVPKFYERAINSEGAAVGISQKLNGLYMDAMDNDFVYLSSNVIQRTIFSLDRNDYSSLTEVMTYDWRYGLGYKHTFCGCYFDFPYGGDFEGMSDYSTAYTLRAYVGKPGEQAKCILVDDSGFMYAYPAELNDTEMVFMCDSTDVDEIAIYKYKIGDEQAQLLYTEELDDRLPHPFPVIACYNNQIYLITGSNSDSSVKIKTLSADGKVIGVETVELPDCTEIMPRDLIVTENNYLFGFAATSNDSVVYNRALVERKSKRVFLDFGEKTPGSRYNDGIIDGRYIFFLKNDGRGSYNYPIINVFDDKTLEFYALKFRALSDVEVLNSKVDYKGDIMFMIEDENGSRSLVLYEDVLSLI